MGSKEKLILDAYEIAARDLRACYNPDGIVAGRTHFNSYWSRDGFWGVFGALELRDFGQAKHHLELFIKHQKPSGQIPIRIEFLSRGFGSYHGVRSKLAPIFRAAHFSKPIDPTALFVIAFWQYFRHTNDRQFLKTNYSSIDRAVRWLMEQDHDDDGLLEAGVLSDWMDSVAKYGKILNINISYYKALDNAAKICEILGQDTQSKRYFELAKQTKQLVNDHFWQDDHYAEFNYFSSEGNILAIIYKIASPKQAKLIFDYIKKHRVENVIGLRTVYPAYPWYRILPEYFAFGIPDYHNKLFWPWITSLHALAKWRSGDRDSAIDSLVNLANLFLNTGFVAEVYERNGLPVRRLIYQSEIPFAWNAAAYIYAVKSIGLAGRHQVMVK